MHHSYEYHVYVCVNFFIDRIGVESVFMSSLFPLMTTRDFIEMIPSRIQIILFIMNDYCTSDEIMYRASKGEESRIR